MAESPRLFIASSREALHVAEAVNIKLEDVARVKQWDNAFDLSSMTLPALIQRTQETEFAVFVFHKDDQTIIRGNAYSTVRDNVLFELGLFIGALGIDKCFVLIPRSVEGEFRLPTDLAGLTLAAYDDSIEDMVDAVATSCAKVKQAIRKTLVGSSSSQAPSEDVARPDPTAVLQSELWRARIDLQRVGEQLAAMQSAITTHFFAVAKPATEMEIKRWEDGARESYTNAPQISGRHAFFVDRDVIVPSLHGANSISVIVAPGVKVFGLDQWSHNAVYFLDGYRMYGR
jgi:hypothetical protein